MLTLCIRYTLDSTKLADFEAYARGVAGPIERCGGKVVGYFAPTKFAGPTNVGLSLIDFPSLAAYERYREALRISPDRADAHYNWGNALFAAGQLEEAIDHYREAVRLDPNAAEAYNNWGRALAQQGQWTEAISKYREALRIRPHYPLASGNLDDALLQVGRAPARPP